MALKRQGNEVDPTGTWLRMATVSSLVLTLLITAVARAGERAVWIDTDPACGLGVTDDVDDCWALLLALKTHSVVIRGVSTVFGNVDQDRAHSVAERFLQRCAQHSGQPAPSVYRGAAERIAEVPVTNPAVSALAAALERETLTVVALGPLTNVALLLRARPDLGARIRSVIAIAGSRTGERRFFFRDGGLLHLHDLNFLKDPKAFALVIEEGVPLVLLPFEAAQQVRMGPDDLKTLAVSGPPGDRLAQASLGWLDFWRLSLGEEGFYPFDSLAMGYAIDPTHFGCVLAEAKVRFRYGRFRPRDELLVDTNPGTDANITYCLDVSPRFHAALLVALARHLDGTTSDSPTDKHPKGD